MGEKKKFCFELEDEQFSILKAIIDGAKEKTTEIETPSVETTSSGEGIDTGSVSETSAGSSPAQPSSEGEKSG